MVVSKLTVSILNMLTNLNSAAEGNPFYIYILARYRRAENSVSASKWRNALKIFWAC